MGRHAQEQAARSDDILLSRRTLLTAAMAGAGLLLVAPARVHAATPLLIENASRLYTVEVARMVVPRWCE